VVAGSAVVLEEVGSRVGWGRMRQLGGILHILAFVAIQMRFVLNGEAVLGARFLMMEIRPSRLRNRCAV
jgi:hypothetical protein